MPDNKSDSKVGAIYGRVSVDEAASAEHGSLEQQMHMGMEFVKYLTLKTGIEHVVKFTLIEDRGVSGGNTKRPQYQRLLRLIRAREIDFVASKEISRLSRSLSDFCDLMKLCKENNVAVYIRGLDIEPTSPTGELMYKIVALLAEFERNLIIQRTRDSIRSSAIHNAKINGGIVPLGFNRHPEKRGFWIKNEEELKTVEFVMEAFIQTKSYQETLQLAKRKHVTNKHGKPFGKNSLKRLLTNPKYIGKMRVPTAQGEVWVNLPYGCAVREELYHRVQSVVNEISSDLKNMIKKRDRVYLLSGLLRHKSGLSYIGVSGTKRNGTKEYYYRCKAVKTLVPAKRLEDVIVGEFVKICSNSTELNEALKQLGTAKVEKLQILDSQIRRLNQEIEKTQNRDSELMTALREKMDSSKSPLGFEWLEAQIKDRQERVLSLTEQRDALVSERASFLTASEKVARKYPTAVSAVMAKFSGANPHVKRAILKDLFSKVVLDTENQTLELCWRSPGDSDNDNLGIVYGNEWGG